MPLTKSKYKEQGAWFEIECVSNVIKAKEAKGKDATFERNLLLEWSKHKGYEAAKQALEELNNG